MKVVNGPILFKTKWQLGGWWCAQAHQDRSELQLKLKSKLKLDLVKKTQKCLKIFQI